MAWTDLGGDLDFDSTAPVSTGNAFADMLMGNIADFQQAERAAEVSRQLQDVRALFSGRLSHRQESDLEFGSAGQSVRYFLGEKASDI